MGAFRGETKQKKLSFCMSKKAHYNVIVTGHLWLKEDYCNIHKKGWGRHTPLFFFRLSHTYVTIKNIYIINWAEVCRSLTSLLGQM